ncbi:unnamed protein product [Caenorhabditis sp. 36 PRJEB53466]|nr:unnamed protein product [Caenorhabditis sp. 36 PRJEB53466]
MGRRRPYTTVEYIDTTTKKPHLMKKLVYEDCGAILHIIEYEKMPKERGTISRMEPAGHSSATHNIVVPNANPPQPPAAMREEGATLSPPNTWSSSSVEFLDDDNDNRLLFTCTFTLPHGNVLSSATYADGFTDQYLPIGANFLTRLEPKGQSFILSAAAASVKQRIFARVSMPDNTLRACELLCEFEPDRAKITVLALRSAFTPSIQGFHSFTFITKHSSTCALTHIDYASIPYLGLLPTDLIGKSLLAFVYAPDVHVVRQAHIDLNNSKGKVVKSIADLRLVAHNGAILRCSTEWSAYVNPWTRKIELVVARHRILYPPIGDTDVLSAPAPGHQMNTLPPVMAKTFEDELRSIMNKPVPSTSRHHHLKEQHALTQLAGFPGTTDLGVYIDKLVEHLVVNSTAQQQQKAAAAAAAAAAQAAQAAVVATAQIRKVASASAPPAPTTSSTDPPLSYTQINCLENVHRLLKSQSRPESPAKQDEPFDEKKYPPTAPLTREALIQHTKRFEEEYKDTWCRRLKRLSDDVPSSPPPPTKQSRPVATAPVHWNMHQKQEFYRNLAPAPPPPPGKNYQITYTPLDDPTDQKSTSNTKSDVENHVSAYISMPLTASKFSTPMRLSIDGGSTTTSTPPMVQRLLMSTSTGGGSPTSGSNSPPVFPKTSSSSSLLMLRDSQ